MSIMSGKQVKNPKEIWVQNTQERHVVEFTFEHSSDVELALRTLLAKAGRDLTIPGIHGYREKIAITDVKLGCRHAVVSVRAKNELDFTDSEEVRSGKIASEKQWTPRIASLFIDLSGAEDINPDDCRALTHTLYGFGIVANENDILEIAQMSREMGGIMSLSETRRATHAA